MNSRTKKIVLIIFLLISVWMISGVFNKEEKKVVSQVSGESSSAYKVVTVHKENLPPSKRYFGKVSPGYSVLVRPKVSGNVHEINARSGDALSKGQAILKIDMGDAAEDLDKSKTRLSIAERNYKSATGLYKKGIYSQHQLDNALVDLESARGALINAKDRLSNYTITSPADCILYNSDVKVGDHLTPASIDIGRCIDDSVVVIKFDVSESDVQKVFSRHIAKDIDSKPSNNPNASNKISKKRTDAIKVARDSSVMDNHEQIFVLDGQGKKHEADLMAINKIPSEGNYGYTIEVSVKNTGKAFVGGGIVDLIVMMGKRNVFKVPHCAISADGAGSNIIKIREDGFVRFRPVSIISQDAESVWIDGDEVNAESLDVFILGHKYLQDGSKMTV